MVGQLSAPVWPGQVARVGEPWWLSLALRSSVDHPPKRLTVHWGDQSLHTADNQRRSCADVSLMQS